MKYIDIYVTAKPSEANKIANVLVRKKLAACINLIPIKSIYRWKNKIVNDNEIALFIKTKASLYKEVEEQVKKLCSYKVPCILVSEVKQGNKEYLQWIDKETK